MEYVDLVEHSQSMQAPYFYEGFCDGCESVHRLPRSDRAVAASQALMERFRNMGAPTQQPKMYGVLVGRDAAGARRSLQAFSGQLEGPGDVSGWVPSVAIPPAVAAAERRTLSRLEQLRSELALLDASSLRADQEQLRAQFEVQLQSQKVASRAQREHRAALREELAQRPNDADKAARSEALNEESRQEGMVLRRLKAERTAALQPIQEQLAEEEQRRRELKTERRTLSRALQEQMHAAVTLMSLGGQERSLLAIYGRDAPPTGTGECCAPKLLQAAAREGIRPEGMAEFWWGAPTPDGQRQAEHFYGACEEKCVPIMGHLLCGLEEGTPRFIPPDVSNRELQIVYEDAHLWVVDKPSGLLSVPGRGLAAADSVLSRLALMAPKESVLKAVHRLDMDTSGLLLIARSPEAHRHVSQQFAERRVEKRYEGAGARFRPNPALAGSSHRADPPTTCALRASRGPGMSDCRGPTVRKS